MKKTDKLSWINVVKAISIIAVVLGHALGHLYYNETLVVAAYFCVNAFIFVAGYGARLSHIKSNSTSAKTVLVRLKRLFMPYALAVAIYFLYKGGGVVNIDTYFNRLIHFNTDMIFYYIAILVQLIIISPVLNVILSKLETLKLSHLYVFISFVAVTVFSQYLIRSTEVFDFLASQFLFGSRYLLVYYLGMIAVRYDKPYKSKKRLQLFTSISFVSVCVVVWFILTFYYKIFWGDFPIWERHPPGPALIIYALVVIWFVKNLVTMFEDSKIVKAFDFLGNYTLDIYLYHMLILDFGTSLIYGINFIVNSPNWVIQLAKWGIAIAEVVIPVFIRVLYTKVIMFFRSQKTNDSLDK